MKIVRKARRALEAFNEDGGSGLLRKLRRDFGAIPARGSPTGRTCLVPYANLQITTGGAVYLCCSGWVKYRLGVLSRGQSIVDLWNGRVARAFREAMRTTELDRVCRCDVCPKILGGRLPRVLDGRLLPGEAPRDRLDVSHDEDVIAAFESGAVSLPYPPLSITLALDERCNLRCPTCRSQTITSLPRFEELALDRVAENLELVAPSLRKLELLGSGEVFYSPFGLALLRRLDAVRFPKLRVHLITNGILCNEAAWTDLGRGAELVKMIGVSIDAATPETYEAIRLGGKWRVLQRNLGFIRSLKAAGHLERIGFNFVITARNFREIPAFIRMAREFEAEHCMFLRVQRWPGAATKAEYDALAVHEPGHPEHREYLSVLEDPLCRLPGVMLPAQPSAPA